MTQLRKGIDIVRDCEFVRHLRKEYPKFAADLMSFRNTLDDLWVIGIWRNRAEGLVDELHGFESHDQITRDDRLGIDFRLSPQHQYGAIKAYQQYMLGQDRARFNKERDEQEQHRDLIKACKSRAKGNLKDSPDWDLL